MTFKLQVKTLKKVVNKSVEQYYVMSWNVKSGIHKKF